MNKTVAIVAMISASGCSMTEPPCEDILIAKEQLQECQLLQTKISQAKQRPILRTELERRYQESCVDVRFYRDEHDSTLCEKNVNQESGRQSSPVKKKSGK
ncbi:hypothetical protein [Thalassotalea ganghwensis]